MDTVRSTRLPEGGSASLHVVWPSTWPKLGSGRGSVVVSMSIFN